MSILIPEGGSMLLGWPWGGNLAIIRSQEGV